MKQILIKKGQVEVEEIPAPKITKGHILVQVINSCISIGTEMSGIKNSGNSLWKKALKQPEKVKKVIDLTIQQGISKTYSIIKCKLDAGNPTGYSAAGIVLEVGSDILSIKPGDRVACAGAQCAHHAEVICVPQNLTVKIPETLSFEEASTATLGAIALQGIRRAKPTLGENFVVLGLGILGQLTTQMLKANGSRVIGIDLYKERISQALKHGLDLGFHPLEDNNIEQTLRFTDGIGADGVIITADNPSDEIIKSAFNLCRKKGRVILVGDVGLNLSRGDFYQKELDFFISTSYGPGRYDNLYEEQGLDYPLAYVRWTENRNLMEYLRLIAENKIAIKQLIAKIYPLIEAPEAYEALKNSSAKPLMILLSYPPKVEIKRKILNPLRITKVPKDKIKIAVIGAGSFAKGMHLPNLRALSNDYHIQTITSRTGHNAMATAKQFGANNASTDFKEVLNDNEVDAVLITTRHNLHSKMTLDALKAGKHVLVEKPLSLNQVELQRIVDFYETAKQAPILLTGFNRRFSPSTIRIQEIISSRSNPMVINYRMNAGYIPLDHWVHSNEGGGRNIGEACHIYDLFTFLTNSKVKNISALSLTPKTNYYSRQDNFVATMDFADGSLATLTYTDLGNNKHPKEQMEIFVDGKVLMMNDYKSLNIIGTSSKDFHSKIIDKGQKEELKRFARSIKSTNEATNWAIPLWQQVQAMEIAYQVEEMFKKNHQK